MKNIIKTLLIFPLLFLLTACVGNDDTTKSTGRIVVLNNNIDLKKIPIMGGKVDAKFRFQNNGEEEIRLLNAETSCMCTDAVINSSGGVVSPIIKMAGHGAGITKLNQTIAPGEWAELVATFDPMAHGPNGVGPISRDVYVRTNSNKTPELRFSFQGDVIK